MVDNQKTKKQKDEAKIQEEKINRQLNFNFILKLSAT